jgi:cardiolipin synthase
MPAPTGSDRVLVVSGGPHHRRSMIKRAYQLAITQAERRLVIVTPYFLPGPRLVRTMLKALKRGVQVTLLLPGESDVPLLRIVSHPYLNLLLKAGVEVYERGGTVLHAKLMMVDDLWSLLGSANFDQRSFYRNYETNLMIESADFNREVAAMLREELAKSTRLTDDRHQRRRWYEALLEWFFSPLKRFL